MPHLHFKERLLSAFPSNKVITYFDDILIMGNSFKEHLGLVQKVLMTLHNCGIKINAAKCAFFKSETEFLGHQISRTGLKKSPEYVKKIASYPRPETKGQLREFLGFINFQRKFLPNCSEIQRPLSCQTSGQKNKRLEWTPDMIESFDTLKTNMQKDLELAYPDFSDGADKLELWVDASNFGAGAYLAQKQGECHRVIGFASMMFSGSQLNYSTLERELCGLRWGIKTFRPFLYGVPFVLYTDHQPLVHLNNMKIICSTLARTIEELADFVFEIRYLPGHLNTAADALSRLNGPRVDYLASSDPSLPEGLVIDDMCAQGGGDSMIISLLRCLRRLTHPKTLPDTEVKLRELLVDELLARPEFLQV